MLSALCKGATSAPGALHSGNATNHPTVNLTSAVRATGHDNDKPGDEIEIDTTNPDDNVANGAEVNIDLKPVGDEQYWKFTLPEFASDDCKFVVCVLGMI